MHADPLTVYVVEDDASVRDSLALMLGLAGYRTALFSDAEGFLAAYRSTWNGCVVADLRLPGVSGIELQAALRDRGSRLPFIIVTGHGDVSTARTAFKAEAVDFLEKPFDRIQLVAAIEAAFAREERRLSRRQVQAKEGAKLASLTPREREVLERTAKGMHAKEIGAALGINTRTVEVHKARLMSKLGVRNVAELVRFAISSSEPDE
ncbi:MAG: response regulator transcription factor [Burkholderiales bacterium]